MDRIVGIGDYIISNDEQDILKTYSLGSCVAMTVYSKQRKVAGLIHMALSHPSIYNDNLKPEYYVLTGIPKLLENMNRNYGCHKKEINICLFGGSSLITNNDLFHIGENNIQTSKEVLQRLGYTVSHCDVGGTISRTVYLEVLTGDITLFTQPMTI